MKATKEESYRIQILRGIAIIAVVCIHNTSPGTAQIWSRPFINFAVGMFIFLSGLLSNEGDRKPLHRIKKVIIPYVIWTIIYTFLYNHSILVKHPEVLLVKLFNGQSAAIMYYIFVYCELTLLLPIIDKIAKSKYKVVPLFISPCEILLMRLIPILLGYQFNRSMSIIMQISCMGWFTYYYLGYLMGNSYLNMEKIDTKKIICCIICGGGK